MVHARHLLGVIARLDRAIQYSRDGSARAEKPRRTGSSGQAGGRQRRLLTRLRIPAARNARVMPQRPPSKDRRARGTPDAGCTRKPCVQRTCALCARKQYRFSRNNRHSPRNGFAAYKWSPRCAGLFSHRRLVFVTRGLISASGDRDRTISPSAKMLSSTRFKRAEHPRGHRIPLPTSVTIAIRPSWRRRDGRI